MILYNRFIYPVAMDSVCSRPHLGRERARVIPRARGTVLEVGIGSGLNLPFYNGERVSHLTGIDPSAHAWRKNRVDTASLRFGFEFIQASAGSLPLPEDSVDTVVTTFTLCTIPDIPLAFSEIRRVLKAGGILLFCEHGKAPEPAMQSWQRVVNPLWQLVSGGCHLTRDIPGIVTDNGFKITWLGSGYSDRRSIGGFHYWGEAKKA
jgi:SAM-dependent methyltransferase